MATVEQRVMEVMCETLDVSPKRVHPSARIIDNLGADSLDTVELMLALEDEFRVLIYAEEAQDLTTVRDCIALVERKLKGSSPWVRQCEQMWGERWKATLAGMIDVNRESVQRWAKGERPIPDEIRQKVAQTYKIWRGE